MQLRVWARTKNKSANQNRNNPNPSITAAAKNYERRKCTVLEQKEELFFLNIFCLVFATYCLHHSLSSYQQRYVKRYVFVQKYIVDLRWKWNISRINTALALQSIFRPNLLRVCVCIWMSVLVNKPKRKWFQFVWFRCWYALDEYYNYYWLIWIYDRNMAHTSQSERSIHDMLRDTPSMNESSSAIHSGTEHRIKHPNSLPLHNISGKSKLDICSYWINMYHCIDCLYEMQFQAHLQWEWWLVQRCRTASVGRRNRRLSRTVPPRLTLSRTGAYPHTNARASSCSKSLASQREP